MNRGTVLDRAFADIGFASYTFDLTPEETAQAFGRLDTMMAQAPWNGLVGYVPGGDEPSRETDIGTDANFDEAIISNLALKLAPTYGKAPLGNVRHDARMGKDAVHAATLTIPTSVRSAVRVIGGGDRYWRLGL